MIGSKQKPLKAKNQKRFNEVFDEIKALLKTENEQQAIRAPLCYKLEGV